MWIDPINCDEFIEKVGPCLESNDADQLARTILNKWTPRQLCTLINHPEVNIRRVVVLALGLVGNRSQLRWLKEALLDNDAKVNNLAEHAMWTIWFRSGNPKAQKHFNLGLASLDQQDYEKALAHFHEANLIDPSFAEPYHQASIVRYLNEDYYTAVQSARQAVSLMPIHFGAWATMGHAYAQIGDISQAAACYRRAIGINPRMHAVSRALQRIKKAARGPKRGRGTITVKVKKVETPA